MKKFNEEALAEALKESAMKAAAEPKKMELQRQTIVYNIPKHWIAAIKTSAGNSYTKVTYTDYVREAIREKLERDGLI